jgi:mRNA-degrading endonuclease RelE of RelBE toxin-antitoxin system
LLRSNILATVLDTVFRILYEEAAEDDLRHFRAYDARRILDEVDAQLTKEPLIPNRRKKVLEGLVPPWDKVRPVWQLRIGDFRVFYDVDEERQAVIVRAIRRKGAKATEEIL